MGEGPCGTGRGAGLDQDPTGGGSWGGSPDAEASFMVPRNSEYRPARILLTTMMNSLVVNCCNDNGCQIVFRGRAGRLIRTSPSGADCPYEDRS